MIFKCYEEVLEDPPLWWLFPEEEWRSIHELPILGALLLWIVSERLFTHLSSPSMWEKVRVEFILGSGWKISGDIIPMAVLIIQKGGRGKPGHGDYLLLPWSGKGGVTGTALHLMPVGLSQTEHSSSENICQLPLPPHGLPDSFTWM